MKAKDAGFTLIELLVVIGVLYLVFAYFVSCILPRLKVAALHSVCTRNIKELDASAMVLLMNPRDPWPTNNSFWVAPYLVHNADQKRFLECPCDRGAAVWPRNCNFVFLEMGTSYSFAWTGLPRAGVSGVFNSDNPASGINQRLANTSKKAVFFEPTLNADNPASDTRTQWHFPRRGSSIGFLDGHAEFVTTNYSTLPAAGSESNRYYY